MSDTDSPERRRARAILELLGSSSPATTAELASTLELHPVTVERRCRSLQQDGYVRQCTGGVYTLADSDGDRRATNPADATGERNTTNPAD